MKKSHKSAWWEYCRQGVQIGAERQVLNNVEFLDRYVTVRVHYLCLSIGGGFIPLDPILRALSQPVNKSLLITQSTLRTIEPLCDAYPQLGQPPHQ